jgi:hypothetical protein
VKTWEAALLLGAGLCSTVARGQECSEDPADLVRLADAVDDEIKGLRIWSLSWGSIYGATAVGSAVAAANVHGSGTQIDLTIGAIGAGIGALSFFVLPLRLIHPLTKLRDNWNDPNRCRILHKVAEEEVLGKSWLGHVGNVAVNAAILLTLGLGFHRWQTGFISAGVGLAVGELTLWSQPTGLPRALNGAMTPQIHPVPIVGTVNGIGVAGAF